MSEETSVKPDANAPPPETTETEQLTKPAATLPDEPTSEVEKLKADYADIVKQVQEIKEAKDSLEKRLKDNQEYISRTRNVDKVAEPAKPQKTLDDYLEEVTKKFEDDPKEGLKKVIRDIAYDRDLERTEYAKNVAQAEDRAFKKMLAINPESNKVLKEIEKLDEECPDLQGLSFERKVEFIQLRNGGNKQREIENRDKTNREVDLAGSVGGSNLRGGGQKIPAWVNDPEAVAALGGKFATKQEALIYADPEKAKRAYEQKMAKQRNA
jgi:flagellar biosynthesis/type III secretory pathway chaperone